ncbi:MAG: isopeptide-forming domain-containing fimbrial protein, partial [Clostridia bacterium]|nr:isopeptide-forming domain-containing fimbrial protein [Clostridia bacterium]
MKKLFAIILALATILCLAVPAFAASGTNTITINGIADGHKYAAYQLFSGTLSGGALTNVEWGDGIDGDAFLAALKADTKEIKNSDGTVTVTMAGYFASATTAKDVIEVIASTTDGWSSHGDRLDRFAEIAGQHLATPSAETDVCDSNFVYKLENIADGYYLVKDVTAGVGDSADNPMEDDFFTKYIVTVTTDVAITVKGDKPVVTKTVGTGPSDEFSKYISNQLNKTHYYRWIGTLPTDLAEYDTYYYEFNDTLSKGLTFEKFEQIYIVHPTNSHTLVYNSVDSTEVTSLMPDEYTAANSAVVNADGTTSISLKWNDLLAKFPTLSSSDKIYVKYSAHLNEDAVIGINGNLNEVDLTYSNSPSDDGYGITLPDHAIVYSFMMNVVKVDADDRAV